MGVSVMAVIMGVAFREGFEVLNCPMAKIEAVHGPWSGGETWFICWTKYSVAAPARGSGMRLCWRLNNQ